MLARFWTAGEQLRSPTVAELVLPRRAKLPLLVSGLISSTGIDGDHLWQLRQPFGPPGRRRVPTRYAHYVPWHWAHYECPEHMQLPDFGDCHDGAARNARHCPIQIVAAGEGDEAWLLYDYGECWCFRIKFHSLQETQNPHVAAAVAALRRHGRNLKNSFVTVSATELCRPWDLDEDETDEEVMALT